jgi:lysophospholipase L1-like esterase
VTSYGHFEPGESPFVRSVRFTLAELDEKAKTPSPVPDRPPGTVRPTARLDEWWQKRVAEDLAAARTGGHRLVMLGDSITQGWGSSGKACWDEFWVPRRTLNLGVSGDKTQHVLWRLDGGLLDALKAANNDVRAVVVMIGTNNSNGDECTADEIATGIVAVVRRLRQALPDANVLLLDVFPRSETNDAQRQKCAAASAAAAAAFAGDARVVRRDLAAKFVGADGRIAKDVMPDFLHLSAAAYRTWAEAIVADVDRMLQ